MAPNMQNKSVPIWIVEDNDADFESLKRTLIRLDVTNPICRFYNGESTLERLNLIIKSENAHQVTKDKDSQSPGLIFLDLQLLGILHGSEILLTIKALDASLPVLILTGSNDESEIDNCYERGANGYFLKPSTSEDFKDLISAIKAYWFERAVPPKSLRVELV